MSSRGWGQQWRRLCPPAPSSLLGLGNGEKISVGRAEPAKPGVAVRRGLVVESFTGQEEEEFEVDVLRDREPVEVLKVGGDVVTRVGVSEEAGCRILDVLGFIEEFGGCSQGWGVMKAGAHTHGQRSGLGGGVACYPESPWLGSSSWWWLASVSACLNEHTGLPLVLMAEFGVLVWEVFWIFCS